MTGALYAVCAVLMVIVAMIAIPADLRGLIVENCKNSRGQLRLRYIAKEATTVGRFFGQILFTATIIAVVLLFGLIVVDHYIKLDIVKTALEQADWDVGKWKENLRSSPDNIEKRFVQYHIAQGGTEDSAHSIMLFLWRGLPVMILLCFAGLIVCLRTTSKTFKDAMQTLVKTEVRRNRRRIQRRYLHSTSST